MSVCIEKIKGGKYCIPVREWARSQIGKKIKFTYTEKSNAIRAVRDDKRNTVTLLSQLAWQNHRRANELEDILFRLRQIILHDARSGVGDARSVGTGDSDIGDSNAGVGGEA